MDMLKYNFKKQKNIYHNRCTHFIQIEMHKQGALPLKQKSPKICNIEWPYVFTRQPL